MKRWIGLLLTVVLLLAGCGRADDFAVVMVTTGKEEPFAVTGEVTREAEERMREDQLEEWLETDGMEDSLVFDYRSDGMIASYGPDHPLFRYDRVAKFCQNCLDGKLDSIAFVGMGEPLPCYVDWFYTDGESVWEEFSYLLRDEVKVDRRELQPVELSGDGNQLVFFYQGEEMRSMPRYGMEKVSFSGHPREEQERLLLAYLRPFFEGEGGYPEGSITLKRGEMVEIRGENCQEYEIHDEEGQFIGCAAANGDFSHIYQQEMVNGQYFLEIRPKGKSSQ